MVQYLTKEEIKQWRSSLEKITLEEFARRLGKEIEENKRTHDIVDMFVNNEAISITDEMKSRAEAKSLQEKSVEKKPKQPKTTPAPQKAPEVAPEVAPETPKTTSTITLTFNKALTDREQKVFDYLAENQGISVKAQELASVLDIPRDYIYKYIRNLRKKIVEDVLVNSDEGGFILNL